MLLLDRLPTNPAATALRGGVLREFVMRQERPARDQRVDLPEIQESFRVSFSDAALAASAEDVRTVLQKARPADEQGATGRSMQAYLTIAAL
ncbi:MAG: hypothetical protein CVU16_10675 [Betaproteobacteria bacterium HGW-Betaproteobacteria-10]|nr:MAG: hypothetical protein CVU16_10675 [Betaproteobacteria bacterium HGW-Betaproteobacteria-10]